jgi:hypothetical protein
VHIAAEVMSLWTIYISMKFKYKILFFLILAVIASLIFILYQRIPQPIAKDRSNDKPVGGSIVPSVSVPSVNQKTLMQVSETNRSDQLPSQNIEKRNKVRSQVSSILGQSIKTLGLGEEKESRVIELITERFLAEDDVQAVGFEKKYDVRLYKQTIDSITSEVDASLSRELTEPQFLEVTKLVKAISWVSMVNNEITSKLANYQATLQPTQVKELAYILYESYSYDQNPSLYGKSVSGGDSQSELYRKADAQVISKANLILTPTQLTVLKEFLSERTQKITK